MKLAPTRYASLHAHHSFPRWTASPACLRLRKQARPKILPCLALDALLVRMARLLQAPRSSPLRQECLSCHRVITSAHGLPDGAHRLPIHLRRPGRVTSPKTGTNSFVECHRGHLMCACRLRLRRRTSQYGKQSLPSERLRPEALASSDLPARNAIALP